MPESIQRDVVAIIAFQVTDEETGEVLEAAPSLAYLHGHSNLPAPLEGVLEGLEAGATFEQTVPLAFGEATGREQSVRRGDLPKQVRDRLRVNSSFAAEGSDGTTHVLWVRAMKGGRVTVTADHPFAGKTVRFEGVVHSVRSPTPVELDHGHAHGPGSPSHH